MDELLKYPKPEGDDRDLISDAMWDMIDNRQATLPAKYPSDQWLYYMQRYAGIHTEEVEVQAETPVVVIIGYRD